MAGHQRRQQPRATIKANPPTPTQEVAEELSVDHSFYSSSAIKANWKDQKA